jgi:hypothetical protein
MAEGLVEELLEEAVGAIQCCAMLAVEKVLEESVSDSDRGRPTDEQIESVYASCKRMSYNPIEYSRTCYPLVPDSVLSGSTSRPIVCVQ